MSEQTPNTECRICGKRYYSCLSCSTLNHWKAVACCPEHFAEYVELINKSRAKSGDIINENTNEPESGETIISNKSKKRKISESNIN